MRMRVCDICQRNYPDAKIKYKYRAKTAWYFFDESGWARIELCQNCLDKIIETSEVIEAYKDMEICKAESSEE